MPTFINEINSNAKYFGNIKKKIKLYFLNFYTSQYQKNQIKKILEILSIKFEIVIDPDNPDYLFYNVFYCFHIEQKYNNAIKIAYYTENKLPDFLIADYAIGQSHMNLLDRYLRIPYIIGLKINNFNNTLLRIIRKYAIKYSRTKFCAAVISNNFTYSKFRLNFIKMLLFYNMEIY